MAKKKEQEEGSVLQKLEEQFGKGTIISARDKHVEEVKEWIPTGSLTLDIATNGGVPKGGKCTCLLGKESASKTTLLLHIIAEEQKKGNLCVFLDAEGTLDLTYAENIGVNLDLLHIVDREAMLKHFGIKDRGIIAGEEWLTLASELLQRNIYGVVGLDSVACLIPAADIANGLTGGRLASQASMAAKGYKLINGALQTTNSAFIYTNQYRMNPGAYVPLTEPFGEAWKYLQALKIEISKSVDKDTDGAYGIIVKGKITKSKVCIPYKTFEYYVEFGKGIRRDKEIIDLSIEKGIIEKNGNTYSYNADKLGVGMGQLETFMNDNPELLKEVETKLLEKLKEI